MKLLWRRWYVKATVAMVVVVALLAVVGYVALKPTYTADEVTKKMQTYLQGKVYRQESLPSYLTVGSSSGRRIFTTSCGDALGRHLVTHYIPYRKAWRITIEQAYSNYLRSNYTWLFDERTGTIASSHGKC